MAIIMWISIKIIRIKRNKLIRFERRTRFVYTLQVLTRTKNILNWNSESGRQYIHIYIYIYGHFHVPTRKVIQYIYILYFQKHVWYITLTVSRINRRGTVSVYANLVCIIIYVCIRVLNTNTLYCAHNRCQPIGRPTIEFSSYTYIYICVCAYTVYTIYNNISY